MSASTCIACGFDNRAGARFCSGCGQSLSVACPTCGASAEPGERFCNQCGGALASAPAAPAPLIAPAPAPAPDGERKQVTVLFADVVNSMGLAERLDPDELTEVMQGLFGVCREAVESFGGTVDKFTGDGIMALFGAPVAQEDHARRACHAALRLISRADEYALTLRQQGVELAVRVGLNSGEVVAGAVGESFTAVGHTVGLAQRMEALADAGTVRLTEHTAALVGGGFALRDLGATSLKGVSLPVRVLALDGAADHARRPSGSAPLIGRENELATLRMALHAAVDGQAQVVGIVGEAGAGKSRLCEELAQYAASIGVTVRRTAGVSHAQTVPLLPILAFMRDFFGVGGLDGPETVRAKVGDRMVAIDPGLAADRGLMFDFMEAPDPSIPLPQLSPDVRRARVLDVIRRMATRRTEHHQALLLILEDLHWFDPQSAAFLEAWLPAYPGSPTLVVTNFRPEFSASWMRHSYYRQLPVAPLDDAASGELLDALLGNDPSIDELAGTLRARTSGNPFFMEESVRALAAQGDLVGTPGDYRLIGPAAQVRVPASVHAVLGERIDRLPAREKTVLQSAAVIGRVFTEPVLAAVTRLDHDTLVASLQALCAAELVQQTALAGEYRFWHPLTQEVAYGTLLGAQRRRLHGNAAAALIGLGPHQHDHLAALIATHCEAAGDHVDAGRWQLRAGRQALRTDLAEAQRRWQAAVDHLAQAEEDEAVNLRVQAVANLLRLGVRTGIDDAEVERLTAEANRDLERLDDLDVRCAFVLAVVALHTWRGDFPKAGASAVQFRDIAEHAPQFGWRTFRYQPAVYHAMFTGPVGVGLDYSDRTLQTCAGDPLAGVAELGYSTHDQAHCMRTGLLLLGGRLAEAARLTEVTLDCYRQRPVAEWRSWALTLPAHLCDAVGEGDLEAARDCAEEAFRLARDSGNMAARVRAGMTVGLAALLDGRTEQATEEFAEALALGRKYGTGLMDEGNLVAMLARAHLARGQLRDAEQAADEAIAVARRQTARIVECMGHLVRARVLRSAGEPTAARQEVALGAALATDTGAGLYAAYLAEERARLGGGDLRAVAEGYDAIGATGHARRLRAECDRIGVGT